MDDSSSASMPAVALVVKGVDAPTLVSSQSVSTSPAFPAVIIKPRPAVRTYGKPKPVLPDSEDREEQVPETDGDCIQESRLASPASGADPAYSNLLGSTSEDFLHEQTTATNEISTTDDEDRRGALFTSSPTLQLHRRRSRSVSGVADVHTGEPVVEETESDDDEQEQDEQELLNVGELKTFKESTKEMMARLDREAAEEDAVVPLAPLLALVVPPPPAPSSSTLPPLTSSASRVSAVGEPTPIARRPSASHHRRVIESETDGEEEEMGNETIVPRLVPRVDSGFSERSTSPTSQEARVELEAEPSDDEQEEEVKPQVVLSVKERIAALIKKRAPADVSPEKKSPYVILAENSSSEEEQEQAAVKKEQSKKKGKRVKGEHSKKSLDEMNRETASLARGQSAYIEPRVKTTFLMSQAFKNLDAVVKPSSKPPATRLAALPMLVAPSSSSIEDSLDSSKLSDPIESCTPKVHRVQVQASRLPPPQEVDEEEEDLPSMEEIIARQAKAAEAKELARKLLEKKQLAIAASKTVVIEDSSDDSDLEISGAPVTAARSLSRQPLASTPKYTPSELQMREFQRANAHGQVDTTDSQLVSAGHTFGKHLGTQQMTVSSTIATAIAAAAKPKRTGARPIGGTASIDQDSFTAGLLRKSRTQHGKLRQHKELSARRAAGEKLEQGRRDEMDKARETVGMREMLKAKRDKAIKEGPGEASDEDADDGEFVPGGDVDPEGSDDEAGSGSGSDKEDEGQDENHNTIEEDDEDDSMPVVNQRRMGAPRIAINDESAEEDEDNTVSRSHSPTVPSIPTIAAISGRMKLPSFMDAGGDGGFSQFFGDGFSQNEGGEEGFHRAPDLDGPESTFIAPVLINSVERAQDAARLEAQNAAFHGALATPRPVAAPRQYINKQGFMTQTRPLNLYEDSPHDTQTQTDRRTQTQTQEDSQRRLTSTQAMTQTQLDEGTLTPTQVSRGLQRTTALLFDSPKETPEEEDEEEENAQVPSAQPPPARNAFDILKLGAQRVPDPPPARKVKGPKNAFINDEAALSDEEEMTGMLAGSGDEDELAEDMDAELEELVDNDKVEEGLEAEQDKLARERAARDLEDDDAKLLKKAQNAADGKDRLKRKNGGIDLDDDEFDDDDYGISRGDRNKKQRVENTTIAQLALQEATFSFASGYSESLKTEYKPGELDYLHHSGGESGSDAEEDEDEESQVHRKRELLSTKEAERLMIEKARSRKRGEDDLPAVHIGNSSSPVKRFKTTIRTASVVKLTVTSAVDSYQDIDSQYSYGESQSSFSGKIYSHESIEAESQGNGQTAGSKSAITSWKTGGGAKATFGGTIEGGKNGRNAIVPRASKFKKKNGFAT